MAANGESVPNQGEKVLNICTQEGAYEPDGEVPEAAEGEEAELPPRKWVGVPVK